MALYVAKKNPTIFIILKIRCAKLCWLLEVGWMNKTQISVCKLYCREHDNSPSGLSLGTEYGSLDFVLV